MDQLATITHHPDARCYPRGLVCAHAEIFVKGKVSEHVTYDLSCGGVRLCGVTHGGAGDEVHGLLHLPGGPVRVQGRLVRITDAGPRGSFAIEFAELDADTEDHIQNAVLDALTHPGRQSILALRGDGEQMHELDWLAPVSQICTFAGTIPEAIDRMMRHPIQLGIIRSDALVTPDWAWELIYPERTWRTIDHCGRLHVPEIDVLS